jgi:hypothetical protein
MEKSTTRAGCDSGYNPDPSYCKSKMAVAVHWHPISKLSVHPSNCIFSITSMQETKSTLWKRLSWASQSAKRTWRKTRNNHQKMKVTSND